MDEMIATGKLVSTRLRMWRGDRPQKDFAARVGIPSTTLCQWESGAIPAGAVALARVAAALGKHPGDLFVDAWSESSVVGPLTETDKDDLERLLQGLRDLHGLGGPGTIAIFADHLERLVTRFKGGVVKADPAPLSQEERTFACAALTAAAAVEPLNLPLVKICSSAIERLCRQGRALQRQSKAATEKAAGEDSAPPAASTGAKSGVSKSRGRKRRRRPQDPPQTSVSS